jgi:hypothetical protein
MTYCSKSVIVTKDKKAMAAVKYIAVGTDAANQAFLMQNNNRINNTGLRIFARVAI